MTGYYVFLPPDRKGINFEWPVNESSRLSLCRCHLSFKTGFRVLTKIELSFIEYDLNADFLKLIFKLITKPGQGIQQL